MTDADKTREGLATSITAERKPIAAKAKKVAEKSPSAADRQSAMSSLRLRIAISATPIVASTIAVTSAGVGGSLSAIRPKSAICAASVLVYATATTKLLVRIAASIMAVAITCDTAPNTVQARLTAVSRGRLRPVAAVRPARNISANGKPNRNRTCAAPTAPSAPIRSRCIALRSVCALDARSVTGIQTPPTAIANLRLPLYRAQAVRRAAMYRPEGNMDLGLKGLRAVVTGGTKGIGRAAADIFAQEGASVAICARNADGVKAAVKDLKAKGGNAFGADVDVADRAALQKYIADSAAALGGIDILVANVSALAVQDDEESWSKTFDVDMMHTVQSVNAALPFLEKSKHPSIVIISSVSGREIDFTGPAYGAMKAALIHYAQRLAYQHAPKMIRVNAVSPGNTYFEGGAWQNVENNLPDLFKHALSLNPTGRMAKPEEIGRGIVFLASPASSFTTGTNLVIDGALTRGVQF